jgi:hypothetical protein
MMSAQIQTATEVSEDETFAAAAASSLAAVVEAGVKILIEQPWRVARIVPGADRMTIDGLVGHIARRGRADAAAEFDRSIALAQLHAALKSRRFHLAWARWRRQSER